MFIHFRCSVFWKVCFSFPYVSHDEQQSDSSGGTSAAESAPETTVWEKFNRPYGQYQYPSDYLGSIPEKKGLKTREVSGKNNTTPKRTNKRTLQELANSAAYSAPISCEKALQERIIEREDLEQCEESLLIPPQGSASGTTVQSGESSSRQAPQSPSFPSSQPYAETEQSQWQYPPPASDAGTAANTFSYYSTTRQPSSTPRSVQFVFTTTNRPGIYSSAGFEPDVEPADYTDRPRGPYSIGKFGTSTLQTPIVKIAGTMPLAPSVLHPNTEPPSGAYSSIWFDNP
ncbi:unnamed protein product [Heligmosomoides polygyrus]|uniref:Uncharacterized protein n=1 Tax=Heligmosomoides polygyrus TaxID=6339 RepID=A0A183FDQ2_HELPZ|nr:unnamed protein product [Heligmosomoides polygyrus]